MLDHSGSIRILHVDDEPDLGELVATFLTREDDRFEVESAASASAGLDRLSDSQFDCIVSDYDMAGRNGIEFLEAVREDRPDLPFILYTGKGSEAIASDAISAGVTDYLQKGSGTSQYTVLANRICNTVNQYRSRQAVEATERKLSEIADRTDDILFMFDGDWSELLFINAAYEDIWGGSRDTLRENPESFLDLVHPDDRDVARRSMSRPFAGESSQAAYRMVSREGEPRWVQSDTRPITDGQGDVVRVVGIIRDITEQKEHEVQLTSIIDNLPGYVYRHGNDPEYPLEFVKGDAAQITGYTAAELEDQVVNAEDIIHPEDRGGLWSNHIRDLEATGRFDSTYRIVTKAGDVQWIRDQGQLVENPVTGKEVIDGFITEAPDDSQ
jgi:PAS domain S-box-containing protein